MDWVLSVTQTASLPDFGLVSITGMFLTGVKTVSPVMTIGFTTTDNGNAFL
jgi:hypothetical protein